MTVACSYCDDIDGYDHNAWDPNSSYLLTTNSVVKPNFNGAVEVRTFNRLRIFCRFKPSSTLPNSVSSETRNQLC